MKAHLEERNAKIKEIYITLRQAGLKVSDCHERLGVTYNLADTYVRDIVNGATLKKGTKKARKNFSSK